MGLDRCLQLQNTLLNLILNARDATPAQGRIGVHASVQTLGAARATALQAEPGPYICIKVSDDGSGMDAQTLARVFEPFFTTKRSGQGTGLGLAMVYGFVKQSGGAIDIESQVGAGTTVSIWLPACEACNELPSPTELSHDGARGDRGLALLVEDDPEVRKSALALRDALTRANRWWNPGGFGRLGNRSCASNRFTPTWNAPWRFCASRSAE